MNTIVFAIIGKNGKIYGEFHSEEERNKAFDVLNTAGTLRKCKLTKTWKPKTSTPQ